MILHPLGSVVRVRIVEVDKRTDVTDLYLVTTSPSGTDSSPISFTHIGGGVYEATFTPNEIGQWTLRVYSSTYPDNNCAGSLFVGAINSDGKLKVIIADPVTSNTAEVTSDGRLKVTQVPPTPPPETTPVIRTAYSNMNGTSDDVYVIPSGKTLTIQRLSGGSEATLGGAAIELWYDPNGNGTNMTIIDVIFANGSSDQHDLSEVVVGDGTKAIRMRRKNLAGGFAYIFARWEGYLE